LTVGVEAGREYQKYSDPGDGVKNAEQDLTTL
jgi:hypothetical protein